MNIASAANAYNAREKRFPKLARSATHRSNLAVAYPNPRAVVLFMFTH
jgi:hypothetical protein